MNERWNEGLLSRLTTQFEGTVNDTLRFLSSALVRPQTTLGPWNSACSVPEYGMAEGPENGIHDQEGHLGSQDNVFELMRDVLGFEPDQSFWDPFPDLGS